METLPRQPAEEKQGRPTMLLRKRKRLEENDKKSGKSRRVWKSLWGSYAAGTGTFLMCGHHFVQHEEDVGAHLPSLLHCLGGAAIQVKIINIRSSRSSIQKLMNFEPKKQTKWPIELWTLKQEMETDDDDATIRESFSLVQSILFIEFTDIPPAH